jgi:hypothetical protein
MLAVQEAQTLVLRELHVQQSNYLRAIKKYRTIYYV